MKEGKEDNKQTNKQTFLLLLGLLVDVQFMLFLITDL